jgi:hypothetical protein
MGKKSTPTNVINQAQTRYEDTTKTTPNEQEFLPYSQNLNNQATAAFEGNKADYGNIMGAYSDFRKNLGGPTSFKAQTVNSPRPAELGEAYGTLRESLPTYREFAQTGGYSPTDIQELRARGEAPIRAAYGNTMREMDRARALGGGGGAPNYIAAASKAQRELPGQMADAETGVNAQLAQDIRSGRLAGAAGIRGVGSDIGGLASAEAGRGLQANLANAENDLRAQGMGEQSLQALRGSQLASMGGQASLYGTTPGLSSMFGNQALQSYGLRSQMENSRNAQGLGLLDMQLRGQQAQGQPWWQKVLGVAGQAIPFLGGLGNSGGSGSEVNPYLGDYTGGFFPSTFGNPEPTHE